MNTGIIIVFSNDEHKIDQNSMNTLLEINHFKICFVNNGSKDNTLSLLRNMKHKINDDISIVDIKHDKGLKPAIKAGARSLSSEASEYDFIVYLKSNMLEYLSNLNGYFNSFKENKGNLTPIPIRSQRNVLKDVFSITELIKMKEAI